ncbi:MAG: hypothetical protein ACFB4I_18340 [Cyanophyceae cyanobacterium]
MVVSSRWDLSVEDSKGQLALVVEVKRKTNASPEWAAQLRHNILAHGTFPQAPYFLLVFPDKFYLWSEANTQLDLSKPTYTIDAHPILEPYLTQAGVTAEQISGQSLEFIVASWLGEIIHSKNLSERNSQRWLIESGLYAAIAGGKFEYEAAA